jgi:hypothetical protein
MPHCVDSDTARVSPILATRPVQGSPGASPVIVTNGGTDEHKAGSHKGGHHGGGRMVD